MRMTHETLNLYLNTSANMKCLHAFYRPNLIKTIPDLIKTIVARMFEIKRLPLVLGHLNIATVLFHTYVQPQ